MSWDGPESLGGQLFLEVGALSAVSQDAFRLDIFGTGNDRTLQHWSYENGWLNGGSPRSLGGRLLGGRGLSAVSWAPDRLDVFAVGDDGTLQHWWYDNGWRNNGLPESLGGDFFGEGGLSAVSWAPNRLDIFGIHGRDRTLQHWWYDNGWGNNALPESLGGHLHGDSALSAVSWAPDRLDVFAIAHDDGTLQHWWYDNGWGNNASPENLGGHLAGGLAVSAVSWSAGRLDVFGISGLDDTLQHWWYENGWGNGGQPKSLGGHLLGGHSVHFADNITPPLSAVSWAPHRLDVCAIGLDATLQHWWYENGWGNGGQPESFGGMLDGSGLSAVSWGVDRLDIFAVRSLIQPPNTLQHWVKLAGDVVIPDLNPGGSVFKTEGPTDFVLHARPEGTVSAVMLFVDFSNAEAGNTSAPATAAHLLGDGRAQALYLAQSHGNLTLDVIDKSDLGWRRMPKPSTHYSFLTFDSHRTYFTDAATLFPDVTFSDYRFVFIVAPRDAGFPLSPAFNAPPGRGAPTSSGEIRLGVTLGTDSYTNRYINLVHEVGHLFGLPDLYPAGGGADTSQAGCWCIMSDIFRAVSFLGWHQHKNGWLAPSRKAYISHSTPGWYVLLSPLSADSGLSMIVLPIDDAVRPSRVLVVEVAQPGLGTDDQPFGEGVLLYTVDATIPTGSSPVVIIPKITSTSPVDGHLFEAPYALGDTMSYIQGTTSLTLNVLHKFGSQYVIEIEYRR